MILNRNLKAKFNQYFLQRLGMVPYKRGWLKGDCPNCGKFKFGIHLGDNRSNCFSCTFNDKPIQILMAQEGFATQVEGWRFLKVFEGVEYHEPLLTKKEEVQVKLPDSFTLINMGSGKIANSARNYWKRRGFNIESSAMRGIGYCTRGEYAFRIIIPYYESGKLIYFTGRKFMLDGPKFKNLSEEELGLGKNLFTFNVDALLIYDKVYLVESITNALTLGDNAIAIGGKIISNYQLGRLLRSSCSRVIIILDPDAYKEALGIALKISLQKRVKVIQLPEGKDVNNYGKKPTKELEKLKPYRTYLEFKKEYYSVKESTI